MKSSCGMAVGRPLFDAEAAETHARDQVQLVLDYCDHIVANMREMDEATAVRVEPLVDEALGAVRGIADAMLMRLPDAVGCDWAKSSNMQDAA